MQKKNKYWCSTNGTLFGKKYNNVLFQKIQVYQNL